MPDHQNLDDRLDEIRLKQILGGWKALTDREALLLQMSDYRGGCHACGGGSLGSGG
jgi:hypothetical protein